jgi:hypothetical protein
MFLVVDDARVRQRCGCIKAMNKLAAYAAHIGICWNGN